MTPDLLKRYSYQNRYVSDVDEVIRKILNKTIIPHQLEIQPGRLGGDKLCWLSCPYCYGGTSKNTQERLRPERYVEILRQAAQGPNGGINKFIFAGYATDPLNYEHIDDLLQTARDNNVIFGFHTKSIRFSDRFLGLLTGSNIQKLSYFSISVDAGNPESYNRTHGVGHSSGDIYHKVLENIRRVTAARKLTNCPLDVSATYLVTQFNNSTEEVVSAIKDLTAAGVDIIRFTFPQVPRGHEKADQDVMVPGRQEILDSFKRLKPVIDSFTSDQVQVVILDFDADYGIAEQRRTHPCFARFVFPTIGFDGYLAHCSESAAPHFRDMSLGNLAQRDFWDLFYDYDVKNFKKYVESFFVKMCKNDCRCDRKEHVVNSLFKQSGIIEKI